MCQVDNVEYWNFHRPLITIIDVSDHNRTRRQKRKASLNCSQFCWMENREQLRRRKEQTSPFWNNNNRTWPFEIIMRKQQNPLIDCRWLIVSWMRRLCQCCGGHCQIVATIWTRRAIQLSLDNPLDSRNNCYKRFSWYKIQSARPNERSINIATRRSFQICSLPSFFGRSSLSRRFWADLDFDFDRHISIPFPPILATNSKTS